MPTITNAIERQQGTARDSSPRITFVRSGTNERHVGNITLETIGESDTDSEALQPAPAHRTQQSTFGDLLHRLTERMIMEVVSLLYPPYLAAETAMQQLRTAWNAASQSDYVAAAKVWQENRVALETFLNDYAPLLPDVLQPRVQYALATIGRTAEILCLYGELQDVYNNPEFSWTEKLGSMWSKKERIPWIGQYVPGEVEEWLDWAMEVKKEADLYIGAAADISKVVNTISKNDDQGSATGDETITALSALINSNEKALPEKLRDYLMVLPDETSGSLQLYNEKIQNLLDGLSALQNITSIEDAFEHATNLARMGLIDLPAAPSTVATNGNFAERLKTEPQIFTEFQAALVELFSPDATVAYRLTKAHELVRKPAMSAMLGNRLVSEIESALTTFADVACLYRTGNSIYVELATIHRSAAPTINKLAQVNDLLARRKEAIPEQWRGLATMIQEIVADLGTELQIGESTDLSDILARIDRISVYLKNLLQSPLLRAQLSHERLQQIAELLESAGLTSQLIRTILSLPEDSSFSDYLDALRGTQGGLDLQTLMAPLLQLSPGLAKAGATLKEMPSWPGSGSGWADKLSWLTELLAHPDLDTLELHAWLPEETGTALHTGVRAYRRLQAFPMDEDSIKQSKWLVDVLEAPELKTLLSDVGISPLYDWLKQHISPEGSEELFKTFFDLAKPAGSWQHRIGNTVKGVFSTLWRNADWGRLANLPGGVVGLSWISPTAESMRRPLLQMQKWASQTPYRDSWKQTVMEFLRTAGLDISRDKTVALNLIPNVTGHPLFDRSSHLKALTVHELTLSIADANTPEEAMVAVAKACTQDPGLKPWYPPLLQLAVAWSLYDLSRAPADEYPDRLQRIDKWLGQLEPELPAVKPLRKLLPLLSDLRKVSEKLSGEQMSALSTTSWLEWGWGLAEMLGTSQEPEFRSLRTKLQGQMEAWTGELAESALQQFLGKVLKATLYEFPPGWAWKDVDLNNASPDAQGVYTLSTQQGPKRYIRNETGTYQVEQVDDAWWLIHPHGLASDTPGWLKKRIERVGGRWRLCAPTPKLPGGVNDEDRLIGDDWDSETQPLPDGLITKQMLEDELAKLERQPLPAWLSVSGLTVGAGLVILGLVVLLYRLYKCRTSATGEQGGQLLPLNPVDSAHLSGEAIAEQAQSTAPLEEMPEETADLLAQPSSRAPDSETVIDMDETLAEASYTRRRANGQSGSTLRSLSVPTVLGVTAVLGGTAFVAAGSKAMKQKRQTEGDLSPDELDELLNKVTELSQDSTTDESTQRRKRDIRLRTRLERDLEQESPSDIDDEENIHRGPDSEAAAYFHFKEAYYVKINSNYWKIDKPQVISFDNTIYRDLSIRYKTILHTAQGKKFPIVYSDPLGWMHEAEQDGHFFTDITPERAIASFATHNPVVQQKKGPGSNSLLETLVRNDFDDKSAYNYNDLLRSSSLPQNVYQSRNSGKYYLKIRNKYWSFKWWRTCDSSSTKYWHESVNYAGDITYEKKSTAGEQRLFVIYSKQMGEWVPAIFWAGRLIGISSLKQLDRRTDFPSPSPLPGSLASLERFASEEFSPLGWHKEEKYLRKSDSPGLKNRDLYEDSRTKKQYIKIDNKYCEIKVEKIFWPAVGEPPTGYDPNVIISGHINYIKKNTSQSIDHRAEYALFVIYDSTRGWVITDVREGAISGLDTTASTDTTTASDQLKKFGYRLGQSQVGVSNQQKGRKHGSLYFDPEKGRQQLFMYLNDTYWPFEMTAPDEGFLDAVWPDGRPVEIALRLDEQVWKLEWEDEAVPAWFSECLRIMTTHGSVGYTLINAARELLSREPATDVFSLMTHLLLALTEMRSYYFIKRDNDKLKATYILESQLLAFADSIRDRLQKQFNKIGKHLSDPLQFSGAGGYELDQAIFYDALENSSFGSNLSQIELQLRDVDEQLAKLVAARKAAEKLLKRAQIGLGEERPDTSTPPPLPFNSFVQPITDFFSSVGETIYNYLLENDWTHIKLWALNFIEYAKSEEKELGIMSDELITTRSSIGVSPDRYQRLYTMYKAGITLGKLIENKYLGEKWKSRDAFTSGSEQAVRAAYAGAFTELSFDIAEAEKLARQSGGSKAEMEKFMVSWTYLVGRQDALIRYFHLARATRNKVQDIVFNVQNNYLDIEQAVKAAEEIILSDDGQHNYMSTDVVPLAAMIYEMKVSGASNDSEGSASETTLEKFKQAYRSLHPYHAFMEKPPPNYISIQNIKPASFFPSGDRDEQYTRQFKRYYADGIGYDAETLIRNGLESISMRYSNMYNVKKVIHMRCVTCEFDVYYIQLVDNSWLYFCFVHGTGSDKLSSKIERRGIKTEFKWSGTEPPRGALYARFEEIVRDPSLRKTDKLQYVSIDYQMIETEQPAGNKYGRLVHFRVVKEEETPPASLAEGKLIPYLRSEVVQNLTELAESMKAAMYEPGLLTKLAALFLPFYGEIQRKRIAQKYNMNALSLIFDGASVLLTVMPLAKEFVQIFRQSALRYIVQGWQRGLRGPFLNAYVFNKLGTFKPSFMSAVSTTGRKSADLLLGASYDLFNPLTVPFNPFGFSVTTHGAAFQIRNIADVAGDATGLYGFLQNTVLPAGISHLKPPEAKPPLELVDIGLGSYMSKALVNTPEGPATVFYHKDSSGKYYQIIWNRLFGDFTLAEADQPQPPRLVRKYKTWSEDKFPRALSGDLRYRHTSPDLEHDEVEIMATHLQRAWVDARYVLANARRTVQDEAPGTTAQVDKALKIFWGSSAPEIKKVFANAAGNVLNYISQLALSSDVAYLKADDTNERILDTLPGAAHDIKMAMGGGYVLKESELPAMSFQDDKNITRPGFIAEDSQSVKDLYVGRGNILPMTMRQHAFDYNKYPLFVSAYQVYTNALSRMLIGEGYRATGSTARSKVKWKEVRDKEQARLAGLTKDEKREQLDKLAGQYGLTLLDGTPLEITDLAKLDSDPSLMLDASGKESGLDVASIVAGGAAWRGKSNKGQSTSMIANADNFSLLVYLISDIKFDPDRYKAFVESYDAWNGAAVSGELLWKWFDDSDT
ncbi:hypothetical protein [Paraburkholderia sp. SOS3]|uniref:hypothetical protein n=1 Tax=Paraburkholderia sp. SOS3 TaxID=1926494 RepID=UPI0009476653|nr:hypothetical protein [Paraburkholderia sp. SOS3]APR38201.1 hypothetical protein BTO02_22030 [Paraburkholderia sp. SOS3]